MSSAAEGRRISGAGITIPGSERLIWYFMRVSGLALVLLAGGHVFITHYLNVPSDTTFDFVAGRWANPFWRTFDWLLLMMALWHGVLGLRYSIEDYLRQPAVRTAAFGLMWVVGLVFFALGTVTIFIFDASAAGADQGPLADALWIADIIGFSLYAFAVVTYVGALLLIVWAARSLLRGQAPVYKGGPGQYAWALHRASGIGVLFFLLVHIIDIALIGLGRSVYDASVEFYAQPALIPMEVLLVGAVIYHALNGLRIISVDFTQGGYRREKVSFAIVMILTILLTLPSAYLIFSAELMR
ncbi:MAG: succinate dehydrogenase, cytochrome b556 subunit [Thermomicrobiales bacterium]|nr:succinate dehydrogenase, cytochrome b556 subunit [Thermomicrobiales bacterium]